MEIVRRVVVVVGVALALWFALVPCAARIELRAQDFAADQARRPAWSGDREKPLAEFVRERTRDRIVDVSGPQWVELAERAELLGRGKLPAHAPDVGERFGAKALYVAPDAAFLGALGTRLDEDNSFLYLRIESATGPRWLGAAWRPGSEGREVEPSTIYYPKRHLWPWILIATLAVYVLVPRPRRRPDTLRSNPRAAVVMPDVVGTLIFASFFGLSLVLAAQMATSGQPLAGDWIVPTLVVWALSLFGVAILAIATHYATLRIRLLPDRVERVSLAGTTSCPYTSILSAEPYAKPPPKALGCMGLLVGLFQWRAVGPTLLAIGRSTSVLEVRCESGTAWRISLSALEEPERLVEALERHGPAASSV